MKRIKKTACLVALCLLCVSTILAGSIAFAAASPGQSTGSYREVYTKLADSYMGARSLEGEWASSTTIEGNTLQEQLDNKIAYLNEVYAENRERFIIEEGIPYTDIRDMTGPAYLYETSSLYRDLVSGGTVTISTGGSFSKLTQPEHTPTCERYVFYAETPSVLTLNASYQLEEGALALWIISPSGEVLHHNETTASYTQNITLDLAEGLHSVVLEYHMEDGHTSGTKNIVGTVN